MCDFFCDMWWVKNGSGGCYCKYWKFQSGTMQQGPGLLPHPFYLFVIPCNRPVTKGPEWEYIAYTAYTFAVLSLRMAGNSSQTGNKSVFGAIRPATVLFVPAWIYSFKLDHALQLTSAAALLQRDAVLGSELWLRSSNLVDSVRFSNNSDSARNYRLATYYWNLLDIWLHEL